MANHTFAERLRAIRTEKGLSQSELGRRAGISKYVLSLYENGHREPGFARLQALCKGLGVGLEAFSGCRQPA